MPGDFPYVQAIVLGDHLGNHLSQQDGSLLFDATNLQLIDLDFSGTVDAKKN